MNIGSNSDTICNLVVHQLKTYWTEISETDIRRNVPEALHLMDEDFKDINSPRFQVDGNSKFNPLMSVHWMIFLYRLSNILYKNGGGTAADQVYYLNKIMHSIDEYPKLDYEYEKSVVFHSHPTPEEVFEPIKRLRK